MLQKKSLFCLSFNKTYIVEYIIRFLNIFFYKINRLYLFCTTFFQAKNTLRVNCLVV